MRSVQPPKFSGQWSAFSGRGGHPGAELFAISKAACSCPSTHCPQAHHYGTLCSPPSPPTNKPTQTSSGGGGGSKGPAVIDKRGQEDKCPHCDRTFKQSGRLRDHIARQHAAEAGLESGGDGGGPSDPAAAAAAASGSGPSGKPPPRPGSSGSGAASAPAAASSSSSSAAAAAPKVMMDVGARGGYFDEKSPKLLLQEWCTRNKRPQPRYVTQSGGSRANGPPKGQYGCKVVLPDPKGVADRDVVVFLDSSLAAGDGEEAAQRGAVAALHAVQGDRALDYVLPARYRMVWRELGDKVGAGAGAIDCVCVYTGAGVGSVAAGVCVWVWMLMVGRARSPPDQHHHRPQTPVSHVPPIQQQMHRQRSAKPSKPQPPRRQPRSVSARPRARRQLSAAPLRPWSCLRSSATALSHC